LTPDTVVACPETITVGKVFRNAEGEVLGDVPFRKDFADSCNTAFIGQAGSITPEELTAAASSLGYRELDLGIPVFGGSVPTTGDATEHAANMIGQGKVEASPFAVALASASVANGSSLVPRLIVDPAGAAPEPGAGLPPDEIAQLRELMRGVVVDGTGGALAGVPGGDVFGKTGTAEFGTEVPPRTHAWFTGYQGDIAFAVLVEDGGFGGAVAAPLAAQFLTALASG
ncbi:MAG TPA: penicillin-binding transpeptidase domain-containing protein, partial [Aquihabitans sp.]|nr:penicillin-binding transpeptidase domain-containing protein [Aquihabitans sp.]